MGRLAPAVAVVVLSALAAWGQEPAPTTQAETRPASRLDDLAEPAGIATKPPPPNPRQHIPAADERPPESIPSPSAPPSPVKELDNQPDNLIGAVSDSPPDAPLADPPQAAHAGLRETDFDHAVCLLALYNLGVVYRQSPPITDPDQRDCGIARPVVVSQILPGIQLLEEAPMRCQTAHHLALWLKDSVLPAARHLPEYPRLSAIEPGTTYQCRQIRGEQSANLSEHALGNGFDVMAFHFGDSLRLSIQPRQGDGDMAEAFQAAIRASACLYFTTVLGPGVEAHDDHLHLDIKSRHSGYRLCQ